MAPTHWRASCKYFQQTLEVIMKSTILLMMALLTIISCGKKGDGDGINFSDPSETTEETRESTTALDLLRDNENLSKVTELIETHALQDLFKGEEKVTFFAPTNAAFEGVRESTIEALENNSEKARNTLRSYIVKGEYKAANLKELESLTTVKGTIISVERANGYLWVEGSPILKSDMFYKEGIVHEIEYLYSY